MELKTNPPPGQDLTTAENLLTNFSRGSEGQYLLRIDSAAPEDQAITIDGLELLGLHAGGRALHGVEDVKPGLNERGKELGDSAAGVLEGLPGRVA